MSAYRVICVLACLMLMLVIPVSAGSWIYPDLSETYATLTLANYSVNYTVDDDVNSFWLSSAYSGSIRYNNSHSYNISAIKIHGYFPGQSYRVRDGNTTTYLTPSTYLGPNWSTQSFSAYFTSYQFLSIDVTGGSNLSSVAEIQLYVEDDLTIPDINFTATPTAGAYPLTVSFTDVSNQTNDWYKWNFGDGTIENSTIKTTTHTYSEAGLYSIRLDTYSTKYGYYNLTRNEYIYVTDGTNYMLNHYAVNSVNGINIGGATLGLKNITSGKWSYVTSATGYNLWVADVDNLPLSQGQTIELYAARTGYDSANLTLVIPYDIYFAYQYLKPTSIVNSTGTGTLVVTAIKNKDGLPLSGVTIILDDNQLGITNSAGAVTLKNVTAGTRYLDAALSGYQSINENFTIVAGETTMKVVEMVLDGETPVTTPIAPTTTDYLVDTDGDGIGDTSSSIVGNYTPGQLNQKAASGIMEVIGMIIALWPLILILIVMKLLKVV